MLMKKIRITYVDFWTNFDKNENDFTKFLRKHFDVEIDDKNPEYVFFSVFGYKHLDYKNAIKIFFTGECASPNFFECDYAIGFDDIHFHDRYLRYPLYKMFKYRKDLLNLKNIDHSNKRDKFCCFVCSNKTGMKERTEMFELLSKYKQVDSGGRYLNNIGGPVADKDAFQRDYKFALCFENCCCEDYTTEKIVQAFASGCIPIYYGNPSITKEFKKGSFINCHDFASLEEAVEYVKKVDNDDTLYQSIIAKMEFDDSLFDEKPFEDFMLNIFNQPLEKAKRIPDAPWACLKDKDQNIVKHIYNIKHAFWSLKDKIKHE